MLRGIDPVLTADLLHALAAMGHGDRIAIVDANFPAVSTAQRLVQLPGVSAPGALAAILSLLPLDSFVPHATAVMMVVDDPAAIPPPEQDFIAILRGLGEHPPERMERHAFYAAARGCYAVVATGDRRFYANIILTKGVIPPDATAA